VHVEDARSLRRRIHDLLRNKNDATFTTMADSTRWHLATDLTHTYLRIRFGLHGIDRGSGTRRAAWTLDVLMFDVCLALRRGGVPVIADPDPMNSHAQLLARELATMLGLPGHEGSFYHQMRRARHFVLESGSDGGVAEAWLNRRLEVNLLAVETIAPANAGRAGSQHS
jgi:hypothetical protein